MKRKNQMRLILFIIFISFLMSNFAVSQDDRLNGLLEKIKTYDFGQSRNEFTAIEEMIVESSIEPETRKRLAYSLAKLLETDATYVCKQFVCRQLARIGTEKEAVILAKLLTDEKLSDMARYALYHIDHPIVDQYLLEAAEQTNGQVLIGIINTIGSREDEKAVKQLSLLLNESDINVAMAAARALGKIGGETAAISIKKMLSKSKGNLRDALLHAYLNCADKFLSNGENKSAAKIYEFICNNIKEPNIRSAALKGLQKAGHLKAFPMVFSALKEENLELQKVAVSLITEFSGQTNTKKFANLLPHLSPKVQVMRRKNGYSRNQQR